MMVHLGGPESPEALLARHQRYLGYDSSSHRLFAITIGPECHAVGWIGYWESSWEGATVWECGWHVLPEFQRVGIAATAAALMIGRARTHGLHRFMHAFPSVDNSASNALCGRLGFELRGEVEVEYPKGSMMRSNDWCLDLCGDQANKGIERSA